MNFRSRVICLRLEKLGSLQLSKESLGWNVLGLPDDDN